MYVLLNELILLELFDGEKTKTKVFASIQSQAGISWIKIQKTITNSMFFTQC